VLMLLAFLSPLFHHSRIVYVSSIVVTFMVSVIDGLKTLCELLEIDYFGWLAPIISFYEETLPMYSEGIGWLLPVVSVILVTGIISRVQQLSAAHAS